MKKPHVHAALIKQWADGAVIQFFSGGRWIDMVKLAPSWDASIAYRVKPELPDLEKYGVHVGDLWLLEEGSVFFNYLVTRIEWGSQTRAEGLVVGTGAKKKLCLDAFDAMLVLRRGEVNKL